MEHRYFKHDKQCFAYFEVFKMMMSSKSKQNLQFLDASKINKFKHEIKSEKQHHAYDLKQYFHDSYQPYLEHFAGRSSCSVLIRITDNDDYDNKTF